MINEITEYSEKARTSTRIQYAVRVTYDDGRVSYHIRENEFSARNMVKIHTEMMKTEPEWGVIKVELVRRTITVILHEWGVA